MEELVARHNPWWSGEQDIALARWGSWRVKWIPGWLEDLGLTPFSLNFVVGPRQVGKTTGIKLLIKRLLERCDPEGIFYFNCDFLPDLSSLRKVLDKYLDIKKVEGIENAYIFLDEITSVREWWRIIKGYIDLGVFEEDVITITGSSSLRLRGEAELFPGRRGMGRDITVYPLSFREFLRVNGLEVEARGDPEEDMGRLYKREYEVRGLFEIYLETGGFPLSINREPTADEQFIAALESETLKAGHSVQLTKEIIASIMRKAPSPISFSTIGREIGVSYKTVQQYCEALKNLFVLETALYRGDGIEWRKERKFFFLDNYAAKALSLWSGEKPLEGAVYEWMVQSHLQRRFGSVYYFRDRYEIDSIAGDLKVEVKIGKPHRRYPRDVLILDEENIHLFLSVI
ncbi:MAG: ATP-binding protein [Candidatus Bathyarchaeia archaeon]